MRGRKIVAKVLPLDAGEGFYVGVYGEDWQSYRRAFEPAAKRCAMRVYGGRRMALVDNRGEDRAAVEAALAAGRVDDRSGVAWRFVFVRPDGTVPA